MRAYKVSDHTLVYAWVDNHAKDPISRSQHITDLPDSVDVIGMMYPDNLADWELEDMKTVREKKGTKVIYNIDYEDIKKAYDAKVEATTTNEPVTEEFISFLSDTLQYSLSLAEKYSYDGICISYDGKSRLHMRPEELNEYTKNETQFFQAIRDWYGQESEKILVYEGKPQNLIDPSILQNCLSILVSGKQANNVNDFTFNLLEAVDNDIPKDRYGVVVNAIDLNDPNKATGYFADGTLSISGLAEWAPAEHNGILVKAVGVYNITSDYYDARQTYILTRKLIESVNPTIK